LLRGWLLEREEHRTFALSVVWLLRGWLLEREEHRTFALSVVCNGAAQRPSKQVVVILRDLDLKRRPRPGCVHHVRGNSPVGSRLDRVPMYRSHKRERERERKRKKERERWVGGGACV
jgi:hypothetical protein